VVRPCFFLLLGLLHLLRVAPRSSAFQLSLPRSARSTPTTPTKQRPLTTAEKNKRKSLSNKAGSGSASQRREQERRSYPIFLASAGDEGLAESDLPMAISLLGATTSAFVALTFYVVLAWQRDATMVAFFLGSISNGVLSKVLKKIIQQGRPPELQVAEMSLKPSDGGMPSSHAMSLGFIGSFTALHLPWTRFPLAVYVAASLWYRVRVKLHTPAQIAVGVTVGSANALLFETLVRGGLEGWLQTYILNDQGLLPLPLLVVPAIVGVLLVGSFERRIGQWLEQRKQKAL
jgi:membrane-associated phospholipid phosphatase